MKILIFGGAGTCAKGYYDALVALNNGMPPLDLTVLAVDLISEQQAAETLQKDYPFVDYNQYGDALAAIRSGKIQPEVILVMTYSHTHVEVILEILDGLPPNASVLIEKPLDVSSKQVEKLLKRHQEDRRIRCIDHYLTKPGYRALLRLRSELLPEIAPLHEVQFDMHEAGRRGAGIENLVTGGVVLDHAPHGWAMIFWLLSIKDKELVLRTTVRARCLQVPDKLPENVETAAITRFSAQTEWGKINGRLAVSKLTVDHKALLLIGEGGSIRLNIQTGKIDRLSNDKLPTVTPIWSPQDAHDFSETLEAYPYLVSAILSGQAENWTLPLDRGAQIVQLCEESRNGSKWLKPYQEGEIFG